LETSLKEPFRFVSILKTRKGLVMKGKKAIIVISLVKESEEKPNKEIEQEILRTLAKGLPTIPWMKRVERVTVSEE